MNSYLRHFVKELLRGKVRCVRFVEPAPYKERPPTILRRVLPPFPRRARVYVCGDSGATSQVGRQFEMLKAIVSHLLVVEPTRLFRCIHCAPGVATVWL